MQHSHLETFALGCLESLETHVDDVRAGTVCHVPYYLRPEHQRMFVARSVAMPAGYEP